MTEIMMLTSWQEKETYHWARTTLEEHARDLNLIYADYNFCRSLVVGMKDVLSSNRGINLGQWCCESMITHVTYPLASYPSFTWINMLIYLATVRWAVCDPDYENGKLSLPCRQDFAGVAIHDITPKQWNRLRDFLLEEFNCCSFMPKLQRQIPSDVIMARCFFENDHWMFFHANHPEIFLVQILPNFLVFLQINDDEHQRASLCRETTERKSFPTLKLVKKSHGDWIIDTPPEEETDSILWLGPIGNGTFEDLENYESFACGLLCVARTINCHLERFFHDHVIKVSSVTSLITQYLDFQERFVAEVMPSTFQENKENVVFGQKSNKTILCNKILGQKLQSIFSFIGFMI